jgi:hypothetical protein
MKRSKKKKKNLNFDYQSLNKKLARISNIVDMIVIIF